MQKQITGKNIELTPSLTNVITQKINKLESKFFNDKNYYSINVVLSIEQQEHVINIVVSNNKKVFKIKSKTQDMYQSINKAFNLLERDIRKYKEKSLDKLYCDKNDVKQIDDLNI